MALVRPDGPAAESGLVAGDIIIEVDGISVRGENSPRYRTLAGVPKGRRVKLMLERGETIEVVAGKPR